MRLTLIILFISFNGFCQTLTNGMNAVNTTNAWGIKTLSLTNESGSNVTVSIYPSILTNRTVVSQVALAPIGQEALPQLTVEQINPLVTLIVTNGTHADVNIGYRRHVGVLMDGMLKYSIRL